MANRTDEPHYEVVWPLGGPAYDTGEPSERVADLNGKVVGELWDYLFRGEEIYPILREQLKARFPGIRFVTHEVFGNVHGPRQRELVARVPELLRQHGVDAVISGIGAGGACTPAVLRASAATERSGVPTVSIISSGFLKQASVVAKGLGLPDLAIAEFPGVPMTYSTAELKRQVEERLLPGIIEGLAKPPRIAETPPEDAPPASRDVVFKGTLDEVNASYYDNLWTDGLPIIPPTLERVERFLSFTDRDPEEVIGVFPPANRQATVWNVAVNGVMAGCRPEYMPVLLAAVEAVADPQYKIEDAG